MTHYEESHSALEAVGREVDRQHRDRDWEAHLLSLALIHAVLSVCDELASLGEAYGTRNP